MEYIKKLYEYLGYDLDNVQNDLEHGYLTENVGRDGKTYYWYLDGVDCAAISCEDGEIHEDEIFFEEQFE